MPINYLITFALFICNLMPSEAQISNRNLDLFPSGTLLYGNIPYANDTIKKHLLDIYLPKDAHGPLPLVVWIHGGAWMFNDKYADMGYMKNTLQTLISHGFALASIDYRQSTQAVFPAQVQDCNQALEYLYQNAEKYNLDRKRIAFIGFSAGGHLASLLALSHNNAVSSFTAPGHQASFHLSAVVDFYGPSELISLTMASGAEDPESPVL